jgi:calcineurin-like phosphoesterase family protein
MKTWFTADWHLGEDRFELMGRPFKTQKDMVEEIRCNHNALVAPYDLVYIIGDVCYQKAPDFLKHVSNFNGRKILIRGNHDAVFSNDQLKPYFEHIVEDGGGLELDVNGLPCYLTHYPSLARKDRFNLVGHIHSAWKVQLNSLNVGVDANHFRPVDSEKIKFFLTTISDHYDADVWTAYSDANKEHYQNRGKKSSYFTKKNQ